MESLITVRDIYNNQTQIPVDQLKFRPAIYGLLFKDNQILLSPQFEDGYDIPGGGVEKGETLEQALTREFKEETGLTIKPTKLLTVTQDFFDATKFKHGYFHSILIYYLVEYISGELSTEGFDQQEKIYIQKAKWIEVNETKNLKFYNPIDSPALIQKAHKLANG